MFHEKTSLRNPSIIAEEWSRLVLQMITFLSPQSKAGQKDDHFSHKTYLFLRTKHVVCLFCHFFHQNRLCF